MRRSCSAIFVCCFFIQTVKPSQIQEQTVDHALIALEKKYDKHPCQHLIQVLALITLLSKKKSTEKDETDRNAIAQNIIINIYHGKEFFEYLSACELYYQTKRNPLYQNVITSYAPFKTANKTYKWIKKNTLQKHKQIVRNTGEYHVTLAPSYLTDSKTIPKPIREMILKGKTPSISIETLMDSMNKNTQEQECDFKDLNHSQTKKLSEKLIEIKNDWHQINPDMKENELKKTIIGKITTIEKKLKLPFRETGVPQSYSDIIITTES